MMKKVLLVLVITILLTLLLTTIASAQGNVPFYVCRSGWADHFLCTYKNVYGDTNTTWHGVAITQGLMAQPISGKWVLEYR
jgi:hypothetical protein